MNILSIGLHESLRKYVASELHHYYISILAIWSVFYMSSSSIVRCSNDCAKYAVSSWGKKQATKMWRTDKIDIHQHKVKKSRLDYQKYIKINWNEQTVQYGFGKMYEWIIQCNIILHISNPTLKNVLTIFYRNYLAGTFFPFWEENRTFSLQ